MPFGEVADEEICYKTKWIEGTAYAVMDKLGTPEDFGEERLPMRIVPVEEGGIGQGILNYIDPNKFQEEWRLCVQGRYYEKCECEGSGPAPEGSDAEGDLFGGSYQPGPCGRSKKDRIRSRENCKCKSSFLWSSSSRQGGEKPQDAYPQYGYEITFCCEISIEQTRACNSENALGTVDTGPGSIDIPCNCLKSIKIPNIDLLHFVERGDSLHGGDVYGSFNPPQVPYANQPPLNTQKSREELVCKLRAEIISRLEGQWGKVKDISLCGRCDEPSGGDILFDQDSEAGEGENKNDCQGYPKGEVGEFGN